jgi:hypothetical protein
LEEAAGVKNEANPALHFSFFIFDFPMVIGLCAITIHG